MENSIKYRGIIINYFSIFTDIDEKINSVWLLIYFAHAEHYFSTVIGKVKLLVKKEVVLKKERWLSPKGPEVRGLLSIESHSLKTTQLGFLTMSIFFGVKTLFSWLLCSSSRLLKKLIFPRLVAIVFKMGDSMNTVQKLWPTELPFSI